jgi:hypothetical protein
MPYKEFKVETWTAEKLAMKVSSKEIYKPKFQRKRKWDKLPQKENFPSDKKYIEFLFDTHNSVHAITFGQDGERLSNIDGNNRINAIIHFLNEPFSLFSELLIDLNKFFSDKLGNDLAKKVEDVIKSIKYSELMEFKYSKYFIDKKFTDLYDNHLKILRDDAEPLFDEIINKLKINTTEGLKGFHDKVYITINLFTGYNIEELADVFGKINKYNSGLTEQEALASRLFNICDFEIDDEILKCEIKQYIKSYYNEKGHDEILKCYEYTDTNDPFNAYDFMVGFQNYANSKCDLIHKTDNEGLSLFFKIFKCIYGGSLDKTFTTENVNDFIHYILRTINILQKIKTQIFMENFVGGNSKIFDAANKKLNSLKKNNMYLIITSIVGYIKHNVSENEILKSIEKCILYHFFVNSLDDKDKRDHYKIYDGILYEAGGSFIDNKAKEYLKNPTSLSNKITQDIMENLLTNLIQENIKNKDYRKYKRRSRKMFEKVLIYYYYICRVPNQYLKNNFWVEHIFPFSCSWVNQIDIDRLGNIFPIIDSLNKDRSNKHITEYKKNDKKNNKVSFLKYIDVIPSSEEVYNEIVSHENKTPHIFNSENYDIFCSDNETKLITCFLQKLFN